MKKLVIIASVMMMVFSVAGFAGALPGTWTDVVDPANDVFLDNNPFTPAPGSYSFTHDITDNGFNPFVDFVTSATLDLTLRDDQDKSSEIVLIDLPGLLSDTIYNFTVELADIGVSLSGLLQLNLSGQLNVSLTSLWGDFFFVDSTLTAYGDENSPVNPVPEPSTVLLLGAGLFGLLSLGRKKFIK
jgi:hypothetical protein